MTWKRFESDVLGCPRNKKADSLTNFKPSLIRLTLGIRVYVVGRSPLPPPFAVTWELAIGDGRLILACPQNFDLRKVSFCGHAT